MMTELHSILPFMKYLFSALLLPLSLPANLATSFVAAYNPTTSSWSNLDGGFDQTYIQSNGTGKWHALGSGLSSSGTQNVNCLAIGPYQDLYASGTYSIGWLKSKISSTQFARWDSSQVLTPIPATFRDAIVTNEDVNRYLSVLTIPGEQYQIRKSPNLAFTSGAEGSSLQVPKELFR
ncbi:MAG: hypothetical protein ACKVKH_05450 [Verrucomicrobiales bacterium]